MCCACDALTPAWPHLTAAEKATVEVLVESIERLRDRIAARISREERAGVEPSTCAAVFRPVWARELSVCGRPAGHEGAHGNGSSVLRPGGAR